MDLSSASLSPMQNQSNFKELLLPASRCEAHWYAVYTCANHEKRAAAELRARGVEYFLPLYSSVRHWNKRRVNLEMPLFPSYVFVRIALGDRLRVLQIPSVVHLVGFAGRPAALPDEELEMMRAGLACGLLAEPHPSLTVGRRVRVKYGPLAGLEGFLVRRKRNTRVVISIGLIQRAAAIEVDAGDLEPVLQRGARAASGNPQKSMP
ncbi:MAG TPA: UpxY family transcription antiterminator [Candidatus Acidoferrum sp.]|nr:UpxY family transcription antiterminator [Candidatus Acidoferrum sp.]